jgi:hypothetical protein
MGHGDVLFAAGTYQVLEGALTERRGSLELSLGDVEAPQCMQISRLGSGLMIPLLLLLLLCCCCYCCTTISPQLNYTDRYAELSCSAVPTSAPSRRPWQDMLTRVPGRRCPQP